MPSALLSSSAIWREFEFEFLLADIIVICNLALDLVLVMVMVIGHGHGNALGLGLVLDLVMVMVKAMILGEKCLEVSKMVLCLQILKSRHSVVRIDIVTEL